MLIASIYMSDTGKEDGVNQDFDIDLSKIQIIKKSTGNTVEIKLEGGTIQRVRVGVGVLINKAWIGFATGKIEAKHIIIDTFKSVITTTDGNVIDQIEQK